MKHFFKGLFIAGAGAVSAAAADVEPDKSGYHLFKPTPRELMREMSTDRPDKTESAYTVDAGHFQLEMDVVSYGYDRHNVARDHTVSDNLAIAPFNFKVGDRKSTRLNSSH